MKFFLPVIKQEWNNLFFLHWKCDPNEVQKLLPAGLIVDTFRGEAFIGIVPFEISVFRLLSFLPLLPDFLEINIRTYVKNEKGERGVWFFSLEANNRMAVKGARSFYKLPYHYAQISLEKTDNRSVYQHVSHENTSCFDLERETICFRAHSNTLEHFLLERYQLFTASKGQLYSARVKHSPYELSYAKCHKVENRLFDDLDINIPNADPFHCVFSGEVRLQTSPICMQS